MSVVQTATSSESSVASKSFPAIRTSWRAHVARVWVPTFVLLGCAGVAFAAELFGGARLTAHNLARLYAFPPLDSYGGLTIAAHNRLLIPTVILFKSALVAVAIAGVTRSSMKIMSVVKVIALNAVATVSIYVFALVGLLYFHEKSKAALEEGATAMLPLLLMFQLVGYVVIAVLFSTMVCRAAMGGSLRPVFSSPGIWFAAAVSCWLWLFVSKSQLLGQTALGYSLAFAIALFQSVLIGAVALRLNLPAYLIPDPKSR